MFEKHRTKEIGVQIVGSKLTGKLKPDKEHKFDVIVERKPASITMS
jgi:hypothetical protein